MICRCLRCDRVRLLHARGVCGACWQALKRHGLLSEYDCCDDDPTEDELNQCIAEQSASLPQWWNDPDDD